MTCTAHVQYNKAIAVVLSVYCSTVEWSPFVYIVPMFVPTVEAGEWAVVPKVELGGQRVQGCERICEKKSEIIWNAWKDVLFNALKVWKWGLWRAKKSEISLKSDQNLNSHIPES